MFREFNLSSSEYFFRCFVGVRHQSSPGNINSGDHRLIKIDRGILPSADDRLQFSVLMRGPQLLFQKLSQLSAANAFKSCAAERMTLAL
jgi:hypothetical protein